MGTDPLRPLRMRATVFSQFFFNIADSDQAVTLLDTYQTVECGVFIQGVTRPSETILINIPIDSGNLNSY
jgi:hypothetical protein